MNTPELRRIDRTVLTRDGVRLAVRDCPAPTEQITIVLLHGFCLNQDSWNRQVHRLRRHWGDRARIISYDHRGHGQSTGAASRTYRVPTLADDLDTVLDALHVRTPLVLVGHSMGGMTALTYAGRNAAEQSVAPHGLVLVATAAGRLTERGIGRPARDVRRSRPARSAGPRARSSPAVPGRPGVQRPSPPPRL